MTEPEWRTTTDVERMLLLLRRRRKRFGFNPERPRAFALACARRAWRFFPDHVRSLADQVERPPATGSMSVWDTIRRESLALACQAKIGVGLCMDDRPGFWILHNLCLAMEAAASAGGSGKDEFTAARNAADRAAWAAPRSECEATSPPVESESITERAAQADLLRCVFGNPFRPVAFDPGWRTDAVVALARGIDAAGNFAAAPVLADALEDAGCGDGELLAHLRGPGPHARGCHAVDHALGRW